MGYYAAYSGNSLPMIRDNLSVPPFKSQESVPESLTVKYGSDNLYCWTVHFKDSPIIKNQQMH
jgi:hypothetical protein